MEFIIKKENEKFKYYHENLNIPYNKIGGKILEYSATTNKSDNIRCVGVLLITIISTIALWVVLSWWMIIIWWFICFLLLGFVQLRQEVAFRFEKSSDKKDFEKLNNLLGEIKECAYIHNEENSYVSYGIDKTFKIDPSVWYSRVGDDEISTFFMPGFLFFNFEAIEYTNVEVAIIDSYGYNFPLLNEVNEEQVILNTWAYTNKDGSKNKVRKHNSEVQIIKSSKLEFRVNNSGESKQYISFSNRELSNKIIEAFKIVFPDIHYRENLIGDRTNNQILAFLFILIAGGADADVDAKEKKAIVNFVMKITKLPESDSIKLVDQQHELYTELIIAPSYGVQLLWSKEIINLLNVLKDLYNKELCQELYDVAKEIAFADGEVDDGEKIMLKSMKDILDVSDAKGKSRVGAVDDLGKKDDINDSEKKSSFN
jgi:tellurite resistance protein